MNLHPTMKWDAEDIMEAFKKFNKFKQKTQLAFKSFLGGTTADEKQLIQRGDGIQPQRISFQKLDPLAGIGICGRNFWYGNCAAERVTNVYGYFYTGIYRKDKVSRIFPN
ncbi:Hypothetical predicted protein [Octopus vulgaris]|uniref:Uncharacterized protein n=1 Tax=Octopus vulgaris TaxID=6645 RepID=A0AA36FCB5_OCTVU|nr:Hypothetical predicted protein [Octopus vulgaris]